MKTKCDPKEPATPNLPPCDAGTWRPTFGDPICAETSIDFLRPNNFQLVINRIPNVTIACQKANLPEVYIVPAAQKTWDLDILYAGGQLMYGKLNINFMVDSKMNNYHALYKWLTESFTGVGDSPIETLNDRVPDFRYVIEASKQDEYMEDGSLLVMDSNSNVTARIDFLNLFPISIGELNFDLTSTDSNPVTCDATFAFMLFKMDR